MTKGVNIKKLEADLWESADPLRAGSKLTSNQYCMPALRAPIDRTRGMLYN